MMKKKTSASSKNLSEMIGAAVIQNQSSSSSTSSSGAKHKYHFKFVISALEISSEKPTLNTNTNSSNVKESTKKTSIGTFFKQFSESPKIPRTALLEWKRNSRKRGKLPVCRFQKTIDQNKPDHYIFYTRDEKAFEFNTRLTTTTSTSYGYKDKFLRISLEQLQDEAFSASPPSKLLASKKRICEEEINLAEAVTMNVMERNLVLMEITQNGLSNVDSTIIASKKLKKKTGIFPIKLGDEHDQEIVAYLVLRYTIICSTTDTQPMSTAMISNDITDDTEVSMTEPEVSDDEEDEEPFKSPRLINTPRSDFKESIANTPFGSPQKEIYSIQKPAEVKNNSPEKTQDQSINNESTTDTTAEKRSIEPETTEEVKQEIVEKADTPPSENDEKDSSQLPEKVENPHSKSNEDEGSNFFLLDEDEEEEEPTKEQEQSVPTQIVEDTPKMEENTPPQEPQNIEEEAINVENTRYEEPTIEKVVETITSQKEPEIPANQQANKQESKQETLLIVEKDTEPQSFLDLSDEEEQSEQINEPMNTHVNTSQPSSSMLEEEPKVSDISEQVDITPITTQIVPSNFESTDNQKEEESDYDIILSPYDESKANSTVESKPVNATNTTNTTNTTMNESEKPVEESQPNIEIKTSETLNNKSTEKMLTPEADHDYSSDEDMFSPIYSSNNISESIIPSVEEPPATKTKSFHTKIIEMVLNENKSTHDSEETTESSIKSTEYVDMKKQNDELLTVLDLQKQKIIELENYSNSFHPLVVSLIWGLICSMLYSVSQVEVSAIRPILVATFYTIVVYFGVQLTRAMKFYNYGTHLTNYLKEMRFLKKLEDMPKKDIGKIGHYLKKYISNEDFRFLDDLFRSASWGALFALVALVLKALFSSSDEQPNIGEEGIIYRFFVSGILYKCLYRSVTEELFERLFCLLLSVFLFNEFNLTIKIKYIIDKYTNPKHSEQYKSFTDFEKQQPRLNKSTKSVLSLPHYSSVILATIISTVFSIGQPSRHTFTTDSFIFDKLLGSFVFSYMFVVQEKIELCMVAHISKNFIDVVFSYY